MTEIFCGGSANLVRRKELKAQHVAAKSGKFILLLQQFGQILLRGMFPICFPFLHLLIRKTYGNLDDKDSTIKNKNDKDSNPGCMSLYIAIGFVQT